MIATDSMKQKRYLSYCISRLPVTDKGVKKMTELLRSPSSPLRYSHALFSSLSLSLPCPSPPSDRQTKECLFDSEILESFRLVVSKAKKTMKPSEGNEVKEAINEFDEFVASVLQTNDSENVPPEDCASGNSGDANITMKKPKRSKRVPSTTVSKKGSTSVTKEVSKRKKRVVEESDDEDEDGDDEEEQEEQEEPEEEGEEDVPKGKMKVARRAREPLQTKARK
jgi:hypothetical protein